MITIYCPVCGQKLFEGEECNDIRVKCRKCGNLISTDIEKVADKINIKNSIYTSKPGGEPPPAY